MSLSRIPRLLLTIATLLRIASLPFCNGLFMFGNISLQIASSAIASNLLRVLNVDSDGLLLILLLTATRIFKLAQNRLAAALNNAHVGLQMTLV